MPDARLARLLPPLLLAGAVALVHAPALDAYFLLDDYVMLAFARLLDTLWPIFAQDSMPGGGGFYYRPLTLLVWWLTAQAGAVTPWWQHACNAALHVGVAWMLYAVIRGCNVGRAAALAGAALYALHPIGIGATAWLSDRFDLVAALMGLAALRFGQRHAADARTPTAALALACLAGAMFAKEIGLAFAPALALMWALAPWPLRRRALAVAAVGVATVAWYLWRGYVLPDDREYTLYTPGALPALIRDGLVKYFAGFATIGGFGARLSYAASLCAGAAAALALGAVAFGARAALPAWRERWPALAVALALVAAPALVQAPGLDMMQFFIAPDTGAFDVVYKMRFYYVGALGAAMLAAIAVDAAARNAASRVVLAAALPLVVAVYAFASHRLAAQLRDFANGTPKALAEGAARAIDRLALDGDAPCHVFLLDVTDPHGAWPGFTDSIVKAVATSPARLFGCTFETDVTPWMHNLPAAAPVARFAPLVPLAEKGRLVRTLEIGNLAFRYFNLTPDIDPASVPGAHYLAWNGAAFDDVTADVVTGRRAVRFRCVRTPDQCESSTATPPSAASTPHPASDRTR